MFGVHRGLYLSQLYLIKSAPSWKVILFTTVWPLTVDYTGLYYFHSHVCWMIFTAQNDTTIYRFCELVFTNDTIVHIGQIAQYKHHGRIKFLFTSGKLPNINTMAEQSWQHMCYFNTPLLTLLHVMGCIRIVHELYRRCALWRHGDTKTSRFCPALCTRIVFCINWGVIAFELCDLWRYCLTQFMQNTMRAHSAGQISMEGGVNGLWIKLLFILYCINFTACILYIFS